MTLYDCNETEIGRILIESDQQIVLASFQPSSTYKKYAQLFADLEYAADNQLLVEVDNLQRTIEEFDFYVIDHRDGLRKAISDLQIMEAGMSFRWKLA